MNLDEVDDLATDVAYEIAQMRWCFVRLRVVPASAWAPSLLDRDPEHPQWSRVLHEQDNNALKESALIHVRCLMDFFADPPPQSRDDVFARHYVTDWSEKEDGLVELAWLERELGTFIDKRVAHLTAYRQRVPKGRDARFLTDVGGRVVVLLLRFQERLSPHHRCLIFGPEYDPEMDRSVRVRWLPMQ